METLETFKTYINNVDHYINFTHEDVKDNCLAFLARQYTCTHRGRRKSEGGCVQETPHTDRILLFN